MGKKQKMKKAASKAAAAAAAATVAAAARVVDGTGSKKNISSSNSSSTNISNSSSNKKKNNNNNNNKNKGSSINDKTEKENIQKLLSLAEKMQAMPSGSVAPKRKSHASSSGSGSSATDSEETDTEKGTEKEDDNDSDDDTNFDRTVVNVDDDDDNEDDDAVTLVQQATASANSGKQPGGNVVTIPKYTRGEKKARRLLMKLDLERVPNVSRVTMRKAKNVLLCIDQADVYKCPHTKTLIIFGDVRVEDTSNAAAAQAAERYLNDVNVRPPQEKPGQVPSQAADKVANDDDEDDGELAKLDNGQLDEKDIELVIMQSTCSRQKAIKALLKHNSDVVNAIMELTVG